MKRFNPLYYLLFILLIMGAFASMAQNEYGQKIMGAAAFLFGAVFLAEFFLFARDRENRSAGKLLEVACLFLFSLLFGFRLLYIYFPFVGEVFAAAAVLLAVIYAGKMIRRYRELSAESRTLAMVSLLFHGSIIIFLLSMVIAPFASGPAQWGGILSFLLLLVFLLAGSRKMKYLVNGENLTVFSMVRRFRDHSVIILTLFVLFTLYTGLNRVGILPGIYSDQFPQEYFRLVQKASSGGEKPQDGRYRHEIFKKQYELLLEHHRHDAR